MQQVLFHIPLLKDTFPPDGIPVHGFGVMLFITFLLCVWFLGWRARRTGTNLPRERIQDLVIVVFLGGLLGARLTYMIQYGVPLRQIFRIWEGGIVLYGGIVTGMIAFLLFYHYFLKKAGVSIWRLADIAGPGLALGIALGRVGCFLNGCCYGHVAPNLVQRLHSRSSHVRRGTSSSIGRHCKHRLDLRSSPPRTVFNPLSIMSNHFRRLNVPACKSGDRIIGVNGRKNGGVLVVVSDQTEAIKHATELAREANAIVESDADDADKRVKIIVEDPASSARCATRSWAIFSCSVHSKAMSSPT